VIITWDEPKRIANFAKHSIDFAGIGEDFFASARVVPARGGRWQAVGRLGSIVATVIFAARGDEGLAIISARPASRKEREFVND
jgi:uncharacterized DUF497 family protein